MCRIEQGGKWDDNRTTRELSNAREGQDTHHGETKSLAETQNTHAADKSVKSLREGRTESCSEI